MPVSRFPAEPGNHEFLWAMHMGRECVFSEKKSSITSVKLFGMGKVSGITKKNFKIGTLEDFEKTYVLYVAMAEKPLSSGQKCFLR